MVKQMTTSVAMCTYNGARFVEEQLRSILDQTIPVGEIVICDDGSTDETIAIIEKVAKETTIPVYIHINETNLGCVANFEKAIRLCQGDIIFLSDQDDIWMPNKVETIVTWFIENPQKTVVFGDAILINEQSEIISKSIVSKHSNQYNEINDTPIMLWECVGFSKLSQQQLDDGLGFEMWIRQNRATGATMAFRKNILQMLQIESTSKDIYHDFVLSFYALLNNALGYIVSPLIYYRQHSNQAIGCLYMYQYAKEIEDARGCSRCWTDFSLFSLNKNFAKRLSFYKKRCRFKYSFLACAVCFNILKYIKLYGSLWAQIFCFDYMVSIRHNIKRIKKVIQIIKRNER